MSEVQNFPICKKDTLGRVIYTKWSYTNRTLKKYWGDTSLIKIIYKFYGDDISIDAFNKEGKIVISYCGNEFSINFPGFTIRDNYFYLKVNRQKANRWKKILKTNGENNC